ncbi:MAG: NAD(P)/FAD-dependent oxidoreductase [Simkaniaceae bacterium]|nr:NAD(P)/FAD-dependent oxidoreductase [Simkaniaceae bacterium]
MSYAKVVIIGGGFGGLNVARSLKKSKHDILLLDKKNHHLFQPLLYQVASAALSPADIATPLREILRDQSNTTVMMGDVIKIDKSAKQIYLKSSYIIPYDYLVVAVGARHSYFGHNEWEPLAPGLKTIMDALRIREKILMSFEKAERIDSSMESAKYLNFVIIGGGPTGVEMAGSIAEIANKTMFRNFRRINPSKSKIYLIEGSPRLLPPYPEALSYRAQRDLEKMGVRVMTGKVVTKITEDGVYIGEEFIEAKNVIWAAGNEASPLLKTLEVPLDRQGRVLVNQDLTVPDHPEIFVIGDAACAIGKNDKPLPGIAPVAIQQGRYVANIIANDLPQNMRKPFKYFDKGSLATIGKNKAVCVLGKLQFGGFFAWLVWGFIHVAYLVAYRSRIGVLTEWVFHYMTGMRGARLIQHSIEDTDL